MAVKVASKGTARPIRKANQRKAMAVKAFSSSLQSRSFGEQLTDLRKKLGITQKTFAQLISSSQRAVARWEAGEKPGDQTKRTLAELRRLYSGLSGVMKKDYIAEWLSIPNPAFEDLKPIEVIERGESDRLWRMIYYLEAGEAF
jgi:transcriptional regulator with XRE-family HTH domain